MFLGTNPGNIDPLTPGFYDDRPGLTQGCTDAFPYAFKECLALTPYGFSGGLELLTGNAINYGSFYEGDPVVTDQALLSSLVGGGTTTLPNQTFAVWSLSPETTTPVPEPSTLTLLGAGLAAFTRFARRTARITHGQ